MRSFVKEMSNFWLGKWSNPQIKPELAFAGFYLASLECYWKSMFQTKAYIGFLGQTFPGLAPQGLVWFESGDCGCTLRTSEAVRQTRSPLQNVFRYFGLSLWTSLLMLWDRVATI